MMRKYSRNISVSRVSVLLHIIIICVKDLRDGDVCRESGKMYTHTHTHTKNLFKFRTNFRFDGIKYLLAQFLVRKYEHII